MKKSFLWVIIGVIAIITIGAYYATSSSISNSDLDLQRMHGTVDTAMGSPILGNPSAPITIVEFGDYQCPQCYNWFHTAKPQIHKNYIETGKAKLVFVDLAFLGRDSQKAAQATYCAEEQGKYWQFHDLLYNSQQSIDDGWANSERLKAFAFSLGLDGDLFNTCIDSGKYAKRVQHNINEAQRQGATGTPTFIIIGPDGKQEKISGAQPFSVFQTVMDSMI